MSPKELLALAKACRKAGITYFKNEEVEFELGAIASEPKRSRKKRSNEEVIQQLQADIIESDGWDSLTDEQKLNWSSTPYLEETEGTS